MQLDLHAWYYWSQRLLRHGIRTRSLILCVGTEAECAHHSSSATLLWLKQCEIYVEIRSNEVSTGQKNRKTAIRIRLSVEYLQFEFNKIQNNHYTKTLVFLAGVVWNIILKLEDKSIIIFCRITWKQFCSCPMHSYAVEYINLSITRSCFAIFVAFLTIDILYSLLNNHIFNKQSYLRTSLF